MSTIRLISRESFLALAQTLEVAELLNQHGYTTQINTRKTTGDINLKDPLYKMTIENYEGNNSSENFSSLKEGKAFFTKELEDALLEKSADLAVHSLKDLPNSLPNGLFYEGALLPKSPADILISKTPINTSASKWSQNKVIGTSSLRRSSLANIHFPSAQIKNIRGNLITRIQKIWESYDALLLAQAGYERLIHFTFWYKKFKKQVSKNVWEKIQKSLEDWKNLNSNKLYVYSLDPTIFIPAVSQGLLGLESNKKGHFKALIDPESSRKALLMRKMMAKLEIGCHTPFGVYLKTQVNYDQIFVFYQKTKPEYRTRNIPHNMQKKTLEVFIDELAGEPLRIIYLGQDAHVFRKHWEQEVEHYPLIHTETLPATKSQIKQFNKNWDAIVVSSSNCIDSFPPQIKWKTDFWVTPGEKTTKALEKIKITGLIKSAPNSNAIANLLLKTKAQKILWLGSKSGNKKGVTTLKKYNREVVHIGIYKTNQLPIPPKLLKSLNKKPSRIWIIPSPSSFREEIPKHEALACLGETTSNFLHSLGRIPYLVATEPSMETLVKELKGNTNPEIKFKRMYYDNKKI